MAHDASTIYDQNNQHAVPNVLRYFPRSLELVPHLSYSDDLETTINVCFFQPGLDVKWNSRPLGRRACVPATALAGLPGIILHLVNETIVTIRHGEGRATYS